MKIENYPKELIKNRQIIECNFIFSLYKDPTLIEDYKNVVNGEDIITDDGMFYFGLAQNLDRAGYQVFDNVSIFSLLNNNNVLKEGFERRGGYKSIQDITSLLNLDNIDTYYDELVKSNMLLRLYDSDFPVQKYLSKFNEMTSEQVYDFFDYKLNDVCIGKIEKLRVVNLNDGYDSFIDAWNKGAMMGFPVGFPLMNFRLAGIHKKNLLFHMAHSGKGKTTTAILFYLLPVLEAGENVLIFANEQGEEEWRMMLIASVLFNKVGYHSMNRSKLNSGHYSDEQYYKIKEAAEWLKQEKIGQVKFVELNDYSFRNIKKTIKKYAKLNYGICIIDTLKPEKENSDKAWAEFSEVAKNVFNTAKKEDMAVICTAQLSPDTVARRYLDNDCVSKSKAILECATQAVMFRFLFSDEKEKLKPYTFQKDENGKWSSIRKLHDLDPTKSYIVCFTPKNRFGDTTSQIVYEYNQSFNTLKEIGFIEIPQTGR